MSASAPVMVGVSGGVDSAVAALRLRDAGRAVAGLYMTNWEDGGPGCRAEDDRRDALAVCAALGIPFHHANFSEDYRRDVFAHFLAEYRAGRTPNPDVLCNREIKFRSFLDRARELGATRIATGHYARVAEAGGRRLLLKARDAAKDQSYFLHLLGPEALAATEFPLGDALKSGVRAEALRAGLPVHAKKDSTGICFIGERDFREFLGQYVAARPGEIRDVSGRVLGRHQGVCFYTLGQREGLGIGGVRGAGAEPWYVVGKDLEAGVLVVDQGADSPFLASRALLTEAASWTTGAPPASRFTAMAKTRYRQPDQACEVEVDDDGSLAVRFAQAQRAVTPGQSLVLYDGDACLGGAVIRATDARLDPLAAACLSRLGARSAA